MAAEGGRVEAETGGTFLHDHRDIARRQAPVRDALGALVEDPAEERPLRDPGRLEPRSQGYHGARYLASGDRNPPTESFLVCLGAAERDQHARRSLLEVVDVERHEFAPTEGAGEAEQQDGAIAELP